MENSSIQQKLGDRREILNHYGVFYIFFSCQGILPWGLIYVFITSIPRPPTSVWLFSNRYTDGPLTGHEWHSNWPLDTFQCYFIWTLIIIWPCLPLLPFWNSSSFTWIALYSSFPYFYQNSLFKCAIPKYSLWPLPSNYVYSLGNVCSLTNSCLSFKSHEVHLGRLPSFDALAWCWTTHNYSPRRSHIIMHKFLRKPQGIIIFH